MGSDSSKRYDLKYGVPHGSLLEPLLYTMYTAPLADVIDAFGIGFHFYIGQPHKCVTEHPKTGAVCQGYQQLDG